jgi:hypothetical protein
MACYREHSAPEQAASTTGSMRDGHHIKRFGRSSLVAWQDRDEPRLAVTSICAAAASLRHSQQAKPPQTEINVDMWQCAMPGYSSRATVSRRITIARGIPVSEGVAFCAVLQPGAWAVAKLPEGSGTKRPQFGLTNLHLPTLAVRFGMHENSP